MSKCPVCGTKAVRRFRDGDILITVKNPKGFPTGEVVICAKCGALYDRKHYESFKKNNGEEVKYIC